MVYWVPYQHYGLGIADAKNKHGLNDYNFFGHDTVLL